jgi:hypothetical protein
MRLCLSYRADASCTEAHRAEQASTDASSSSSALTSWRSAVVASLLFSSDSHYYGPAHVYRRSRRHTAGVAQEEQPMSPRDTVPPVPCAAPVQALLARQSACRSTTRAHHPCSAFVRPSKESDAWRRIELLPISRWRSLLR